MGAKWRDRVMFGGRGKNSWYDKDFEDWKEKYLEEERKKKLKELEEPEEVKEK